ncbi:MAG: helix-turn-helix domain-containing protein, partial [Clostridia bacterium]|nr:helix-turn-helix domain-containing protein [Clostridia bacterium]
MLSENIKQYRKAKGMSQEELAERLHVVRQTVSKWEKGLSVPDSEMLVRLAATLETTVSRLLDETTETPDEAPTLQELSERLEALNAQFARQASKRRRTWRILLIVATILVALHLGVWAWASLAMTVSIDESIAVIGGADGPTSIFVAKAPIGRSLIAPMLDALLIIGGIIGII